MREICVCVQPIWETWYGNLRRAFLNMILVETALFTGEHKKIRFHSEKDSISIHRVSLLLLQERKFFSQINTIESIAFGPTNRSRRECFVPCDEYLGNDLREVSHHFEKGRNLDDRLSENQLITMNFSDVPSTERRVLRN